MIKLYDRIKEISYTNGTGNIQLSGPVNGFSSFSSSYSNNDVLFYSITDGTNYEIGSGVYLSSTNQVTRFPFKTTNSNQLVNFTEGLKEIYVTYPATHSVFNTSGTHPIAQSSGLAIWNSPNSLSYSNKIVFDSTNGRLGINQSRPSGSIDIGGSSANSQIVVSGIHIGNSGIYFPSGNNGVSSYSGGRQVVHFEPNQLNINSSILLELSGIVNQNILLKKQNANMVFAGSPEGCVPPCSPDYPTFRYLVADDIPNLSSLYFTVAAGTTVSGIATQSSGILNNKINSVSGVLNDRIDFLSSSVNTPNILSNGRLSISSFASDAEGLNSTLYFVPHNGNTLALYNGTTWVIKTFSAIQVALAAVLNPNTNYDIFANINFDGNINYSYIAWADDSTRITELVAKDGIYCLGSGGNFTHRYLGTVRRRSDVPLFSNTIDKRFISNAENKIISCSHMENNTTSWTYSSSSFRISPLPNLEIVHGVKNILELYASVLFVSPYSRSSYSLCIDSSRSDRINSGSNLGITPSNAICNDKYIDIDQNDSINTDMTASMQINFDGYDTFYAIEKVPIGSSPTLSANNAIGSYGIKYKLYY